MIGIDLCPHDGVGDGFEENRYWVVHLVDDEIFESAE
jgi:hypothetical protein